MKDRSFMGKGHSSPKQSISELDERYDDIDTEELDEDEEDI